MNTVVVIIEPALSGEILSVPQQINEIVGPFDSDEEAEKWVERWQRRKVVGDSLALAPSQFFYRSCGQKTSTSTDV